MSVGRTTARAALWAFAATAGSKIVTLVGLALLARLLAPAEFGLLAFALVYMTYADTIGDLGSGVALVYWPDRREDAAQITFIISIAAGVFWFGTTILLAPFIADFFNAPQGTAIVRALAIGFILRYLGNTHDALAQKDLRFRARFGPDLSLALVNTGVALTLAWLGFGAWSLVWGRLAGVACRTAWLWIAVPWRPSASIPMDLLQPMLSYGRGILVVNILGAITSSTDLAVVGRVLGTTALGLYQMAARVPEMSVMVLLWVLSSVLFPAFSRLHARGEPLRGAYLEVTRYISAVTIPAALGLAVMAGPIVLLVFGEAWRAAAPILSALAAVAALRCLSAHAGDVLKATGHSRRLAGLSTLKALIIVPTMIVAVRFGALAVAVSLAAATAIGTVVTLVAASRMIHVSAREMAASFLPSVVSGLVMTLPLLAWLRWTEHLPVLAQVAGGVVLGMAVYGAMLALLDREILLKAKGLLLNRALRQDEVLRGGAG